VSWTVLAIATMPMRFPNWIPDKRSDSRATTEPATSQNDKGHHSGWLIGTAQIKQQPEVEKDRLSALELLPEVETWAGTG
jgi:hypothetical protein